MLSVRKNLDDKGEAIVVSAIIFVIKDGCRSDREKTEQSSEKLTEFTGDVLLG